jgi:predicted Zn-dependent protease
MLLEAGRRWRYVGLGSLRLMRWNDIEAGSVVRKVGGALMCRALWVLVLLAGCVMQGHAADRGFWANAWLDHQKSIEVIKEQTSFESSQISPFSTGSSPVDSRGAGEHDLPKYIAQDELLREAVMHNWNYADRKELTGYGRRYLSELEQNDAFWNNPEVLDYLNQMLYKVCPEPMIPGRPGCFSIRLLRDTTPNAFALNDGTIVIHEGLLVLLRTEEELLGILAHEVAHVVLDHSLANLRKDKAQQTLSSFLGGLAGGATAYAYAKQGYSPATSTVAGLQMGINVYLLSNVSLDLIGTAYSRKQELEADKLASDWMQQAGCNPESYGRVLLRLKEYGRINGESDRASLADDHPSLGKRLKELRYDEDQLISTLSRQDASYDRRISAILEHYGELCLAELQVDAASRALDRAQASGWYTGNALVLKAAALRLSGGFERDPAQLHALLAEATQRDEELHYRVHIENGLLALREQDSASALAAFRELKSSLDQENEALFPTWRWADSMISKLQAQ